jgi:hypothetical protein
MKTLWKYAFPLLIALLLSAVFHNVLFTGVVLVVAVGLRHFDFFDSDVKREQTLGSKLFAYLILGAFMGSILALVIGRDEALFAWVFNVFLCAGWANMLPNMFGRMWRST